MKRLPLLAAILLPLAGNAIPLADAQSTPSLKLDIRGDGRSQLAVVVSNQGSDSTSFDIPAGQIAVGKSGSKVAVVRAATMEIPKGQTAEIVLPVVPLSLKNGAVSEPYSLVNERIEKLQPFFEWSTKQNDLPRVTAQLAALLLLDNIGFAQWQEFLRREPQAEPRPTPADIAGAIDAISIVRQVAPDRKIAIAEDPEFRLRALRNPWSRAKAMQLFGMNPPEGVPIPDLNQLLHTRPGDNCPICRLRNQADPSNGL